jgi:ferric hydroxamate transport system substrate-binding protein
MKTRSIATVLSGGALLATLLTGCGTSEPTGGDAGAPPGNAAADCAGDTTPTATGPVSLTDSFGRTVNLDKPAQRVAVLEWQQIEDVLTLCLAPVAVADAKGYSLWNTAEKLPDAVTDVGTRGEPNLEALFATNPDLVIIEAYTPDDAVITQLAKYNVPVLATKGADAADPVRQMLDTFTLIAKATGREQRATAVADEFRQGLAKAKQTVADAKLPATEFVYFDGYLQGGNVSLRPFGQGSLVGELGEQLGLTNAWTGQVDPAYGLGQTDIEGMSKVGAATFFHTGTVDPDGDVVAELKKNTIWTSLPAVKEGRVYAFPPGIWTFGGPRSAQQVLDAYVDLLT